MTAPEIDIFLPTFGKILLCCKCLGRIRNPDYPEFDVEGKAIFTCGSCGAKNIKVLVKNYETQAPTEDFFVKPQKAPEEPKLEEITDVIQKRLKLAERRKQCRVASDIQDESEEKHKPPRSQADKLVMLCLEAGTELFLDQYNTEYASIILPCDTCDIDAVLPLQSVEPTDTPPDCNIKIPQIPQIKLVNYPIDSSFFKNWLSNKLYEEEEKVPSSDALGSAKNVLKGMAQKEAKQYTLYNRIAPSDDGIWLDLTDKNWQAIHITKDGWTLEKHPPILFRRYIHQLPLPIPQQNGDVWQLLTFTNLPKDENTKLSFLCTVLSYFIPLIPHPAIVVNGPQGSAKSWLLRLVKMLIDPSSIELLGTFPREPRELAQQLENHWIAPFDNISYFEEWVSDMLCRAITGGGIQTRKLFTDNETIIYTMKRCIMLNGINIAAQKPDLLDRSNLLTLPAIEPEERRLESEVIEEFNKLHPYLLGACLDVLVKGAA